MSAASRSRSSGRRAPARARERAICAWPCCLYRVCSASRAAAAESEAAALTRIRCTGSVLDMMPRVMPAKPDSLAPGIWVREERADVVPVRQRDGLVVTGYRDVKQCLEDPELGGEEAVHGRGRDIRHVADGLDSGCGVAAFEEQRPGGPHDRGASQARPCLAALAGPRAALLGCDSHILESTTLKMRVELSKAAGMLWAPPAPAPPRRPWSIPSTSRECLRMLRSRRGRREQPLADVTVEPPAGEASDPEAQALLADSVGPALMVVLDTLAPAERLAFVLARTTHRRNRLHLQRRQDRRDPRDLRPRTPPPRRPGSGRRLTADNPDPAVIAPDKAGHAWRHRRGTGDVLAGHRG